jgi:outer membrane protein OmpA-like peptidoglycan-associated protein
MKLITRAFIILAGFLLICPALGQADIVYIKNGDKLFGTIQSPAFIVQTTYGKVDIKTEFLKSITFKDGSIGRWTVETVNNDIFSGTLLNQGIQLMQENGKQKIISKEQIKRIKREFDGTSHPVTTTIFTMKNNDRFSGKLLNTELEIRANYITKSIQPNEINRVEFLDDYQAGVKILLENGDLITGMLKQGQLRLAPDSMSELSVAKSSLKSIQFNAPKLVLNEFSAPTQSAKDSDGDGVPDYADICMNTTGGVAVTQDGCPRNSVLAKRVTETGNRHNAAGSAQGQTGPRAKIEKVLFDFDRFDLKPQYYSSLDKIAQMLAQNPAVKAEIQGHTDNIGTARYNQRLSEMRARVVENYFVSKGVEKDRLFPVGFGFTKNSASNEDEIGRALNRRVEIAFQN